MTALTPREQKVLVFLRAHFARYGFAPNYREICAATGIRSTSNVAYIIDTLAWRKYLCRVGARSTIQLLQTEDYHLSDCDCDRCAQARYQRDLELVKALQVVPKIAGCVEFIGIRPLGHLARLDWRYSDKSRVRRKPLLGSTKAAKNPDHHNAGRGVVA